MDLDEGQWEGFDLPSLQKDKTREIRRINHARLSQSQATLVLSIAQRRLGTLAKSKTLASKDKRDFYLSKYDRKIIEHMATHKGWTQAAEFSWTEKGFHLDAAKKRGLMLLRKGFVDKKFQKTETFYAALSRSEKKRLDRLDKRLYIVRNNRRMNAQSLTNSLSKNQVTLIQTLAQFRQMTEGQAVKIGCSVPDLRGMEDRGLVQGKSFSVDNKKLQLITLTTNRNGSQPTGRELAKYGLGIKQPFCGLQKDQSKILHDVSVIDAIIDARDRFSRKGFRFQHIVTEHELYQSKVSANSDLGHKYADAYLIFKDMSGDSYTVAVEFGNYAPSYLKEKVQGLDADSIAVYTHEHSKAEAYQNALTGCPQGVRTEVHVIPHPDQDKER